MKLSGKTSNLQLSQLPFSLPFIFLFMSLSQAHELLFVYLGFFLGFFVSFLLHSSFYSFPLRAVGSENLSDSNLCGFPTIAKSQIGGKGQLK